MDLEAEKNEDLGLGNKSTTLFVKLISRNFKIEKGLLPFKGKLPSFLKDPFTCSSGRNFSNEYLKLGQT